MAEQSEQKEAEEIKDNVNVHLGKCVDGKAERDELKNVVVKRSPARERELDAMLASVVDDLAEREQQAQPAALDAVQQSGADGEESDVRAEIQHIRQCVTERMSKGERKWATRRLGQLQRQLADLSGKRCLPDVGLQGGEEGGAG